MNTLQHPFVVAMTAALLAACASSSGGDGTASDPGSGTSGDATATEPTAPAPSYRIDCHGQATPLVAPVTLGLAPKCVGGPPGTQCGGDPCAAQDVAFSYAPPAFKCIGTTVWSWDGATCVGHASAAEGGALHCAGAGCGSLYKDEASCKAAYGACTAK